VHIAVAVHDTSGHNRSTTFDEDDSVRINPPITAKLSKAADGTCTDSDPKPCGDVELQLHGFQQNGQVACHFDVSNGAGLPDVVVPTTATGDGDWKSGKYTSSGASISVKCETITDTMQW